MHKEGISWRKKIEDVQEGHYLTRARAVDALHRELAPHVWERAAILPRPMLACLLVYAQEGDIGKRLPTQRVGTDPKEVEACPGPELLCAEGGEPLHAPRCMHAALLASFLDRGAPPAGHHEASRRLEQ